MFPFFEGKMIDDIANIYTPVISFSWKLLFAEIFQQQLQYLAPFREETFSSFGSTLSSENKIKMTALWRFFNRYSQPLSSLDIIQFVFIAMNEMSVVKWQPVGLNTNRCLLAEQQERKMLFFLRVFMYTVN